MERAALADDGKLSSREKAPHGKFKNSRKVIVYRRESMWRGVARAGRCGCPPPSARILGDFYCLISAASCPLAKRSLTYLRCFQRNEMEGELRA
jgi:hypothetical protein